MMHVKQVTGKQFQCESTRVLVAEVEGHDDQEVIDFAMAFAGERPSSLFGWNITRWPEDNTAIVCLHTD